MVYSHQVFEANVLSLFALIAGVNGKCMPHKSEKSSEVQLTNLKYCHSPLLDHTTSFCVRPIHYAAATYHSAGRRWSPPCFLLTITWQGAPRFDGTVGTRSCCLQVGIRDTKSLSTEIHAKRRFNLGNSRVPKREMKKKTYLVFTTRGYCTGTWWWRDHYLLSSICVW